MIYGYARVSTDGQTLDAQVVALTAAGAQKVYSEKGSRAQTNRPALAPAIAALDAGDVFVNFRDFGIRRCGAAEETLAL